MKILLITEQREGEWNKVSFETLAAAQQIAQQAKGSVTGVVIGKGVAALADNLAGYQLDEVLLVEHDLLEKYTPDGFSLALKQVIESAKPDAVFLPHTYQVRDFAPKLACALNRSLISDAVGYKYEGGRLLSMVFGQDQLRVDTVNVRVVWVAVVRYLVQHRKALSIGTSVKRRDGFIRKRIEALRNADDVQDRGTVEQMSHELWLDERGYHHGSL